MADRITQMPKTTIAFITGSTAITCFALYTFKSTFKDLVTSISSTHIKAKNFEIDATFNSTAPVAG